MKELKISGLGREPMIYVESITRSFGGLRAVNNATFNVKKGSVTGLVGPNGAGKTTLFNIIAGLYKPDSGKIILDGEDVTGLKPHELFNKGLLRTFQIAHEFSSLSVLENLMMVTGNQLGENIINSWLQRNAINEQEKAIHEKALEVIDFLKISHLKNQAAGNLSGGQKKLLELGRTMMVEPKVVLLDEVGAGVNRTLLNEIGDAIIKLNTEHGYTFCMIEHDMDFISRLCNPVVVMAEGTVLTQGSAEEIRNNEEVIEAYLGHGLKNRRKPVSESQSR